MTNELGISGVDMLPHYISRWLKPSLVFNSQYGMVTNGDWLVLECDRINKDPERNTSIISRTAKDGKYERCLVNTEQIDRKEDTFD